MNAFTGRQLLSWLQNLDDEDLDCPVGTTGHYGEFWSLQSPEVKTVKSELSGSRRVQMTALSLDSADPHYPEPD